jgi:hypothetical protein
MITKLKIRIKEAHNANDSELDKQLENNQQINMEEEIRKTTADNIDNYLNLINMT